MVCTKSGVLILLFFIAFLYNVNMAKTVAVGMSGGVDSSVASLLLKEQGYNVIGIFMHNWDEKDERGMCTAEGDFNDVKSVCRALNIPYYSVDFSKEYKERVFQYFLDEYAKGRTPNPDVLCNREIKFGPFLNYALKNGADYIATGHYAGVKEQSGKYYLLEAADTQKDQTYFLNQLKQEQLSKAIFPLADIKKERVRELARTNGLEVAAKKDSTGLCFIGERNFKKFLSSYLPAQPGGIKSLDGKTVGRHDGLMYYTLGQRRGLGIGGAKDFGEGRWFAVRKDLAENVLYVSCGDESVLLSENCDAANPNWIPETPSSDFDCYAKFRYRQPKQKVRVSINGGKVHVSFYEKQRAVTSGQFAVFYHGGYCIGGAEIL